MKKPQSVFCTILLSTILVGNVFAGGGAVGMSTFGFLGNVIDAVALFLRADSCPVRQCQNCRPTERDENGNCRPRED